MKTYYLFYRQKSKEGYPYKKVKQRILVDDSTNHYLGRSSIHIPLAYLDGGYAGILNRDNLILLRRVA